MYVLVSAVIIFLFFCSVFCLLQVYREESTGVVAQAVVISTDRRDGGDELHSLFCDPTVCEFPIILGLELLDILCHSIFSTWIV